jgi:hypothetical protein
MTTATTERLQNIAQAIAPTLMKKVVAESKPVTVPRTIIRLPIILPPLNVGMTPAITISEHEPGITPKISGGVTPSMGILDLIKPPTPNKTEIAVDLKPTGLDQAQFGADVTDAQKQAYISDVQEPLNKTIGATLPTLPGLPDITGGLKEAGKWILIGGGVLIGGWILTSWLKGRKKHG